jgi:hypothetical protein
MVDTAPPSITCPAAVTVRCFRRGGTPASDPALAAFLVGASATDICDSSPTISNNAPVVFPLGTTSVTFNARDASGNTGQCSADVKVVVGDPNICFAN